MGTLPTDFPLLTCLCACEVDFGGGLCGEGRGCSQTQPPRSGGPRSDGADPLSTGAGTRAPGSESEDLETLTQVSC